jgi:predicted nucleic acid-binding protein
MHYSMRNLIDSSVWVALFLDFDTQHSRAKETLLRTKGTIIVPYCVLNETASVLTYKHSREQADAFLSYIACVDNLETVESIIHTETDAFLSHAHRISFTDSTLLHLAKHMKASLITFDEQLARFARKSNH